MSMKNPLAKGFMKRNKETIKSPSRVEAYCVGYNNGIDICAKACACCWDKPVPESYNHKAEYLAKRVKTGHTSILEHSNFVIVLVYHMDSYHEIIKFLGFNKYLNTTVKAIDDKYYILVSGSYRGYTELFKEYDDMKNPTLNAIRKCLYENTHSAVFEDLINYNYLDRDNFLNVEPDDTLLLSQSIKMTEEQAAITEYINIDSIGKLIRNISTVTSELSTCINTFDLVKHCSISILFKNMSRTATHQLVRHRNAITQESQRYVDYSGAKFSSPETFKPDKYDADHKYTVRFGSSSPLHMTLEEIGAAESEIYNQLSNPAIAGENYKLLKEDARAFLPGNIQCGKLYMTFTYKSFFKFLDLREHTAAQAEIRKFAINAGDIFRASTPFVNKDIISTYLAPRLLVTDPFENELLENIGDVEESEEKIEEVDMTEDDYIKLAGLDKGDE